MTLPDWTREPLVHFLVAGAVLFAGLTLFANDPVDPADRTIAVDADTQSSLAAQFERRMARPPTDAEMDAAIAAYVRDEVLYREGLRLGLDQNDAIVRQRIVSKMDLSAGAAAELAEPDEATLRAFHAENAARYGAAGLISFGQLYFRERSDAEAALAGTKQGEAISLPASLSAASLGEIEARFGAQFAQAIASLEAGQDWNGPIPSGFGWHLVRITARDKATPSFEDVRDRVLSDWRNAEGERRRTRAYETLREAYIVEIEE